jgi:hypothetical protein
MLLDLSLTTQCHIPEDTILRLTAAPEEFTDVCVCVCVCVCV